MYLKIYKLIHYMKLIQCFISIIPQCEDFSWGKIYITFTTHSYYCVTRPQNSFSFHKTKILLSSSLLTLLPAPGNQHSTFCLYEFDYSKYFIGKGSFNICLFAPGLLELLKLIMDFPDGPAFQCRGYKFDTWSGSQDPTCLVVYKSKHETERIL